MRDTLAERLLATVMHWSAEDVARERPKLQAMATFKYDEYQQYAPGERFVERLGSWLSRFSPDDRICAYDFVMKQLVFISNAEMHHFIAMAYRDHLRPHLVAETARRIGVPHWRRAHAAHDPAFAERARRCLILGLSDGARLDVFRRSAQQLFSTEQFFASYEVPANRCDDLQKELERDLAIGNSAERALFHTIVLLDDFAGSGRSFVRTEDGIQKGKLVKFLNEISTDSSIAKIVDRRELEIIVLYYVASAAAVSMLEQEFKVLENSYGIPLRLLTVHSLPSSVVLQRESPELFVRLLHQHYDPTVEDEHTRKGGTDMRLGFAGGGLPLVLSHNAPNNSPSLLWYERESASRALFPRVTRHTDRSIAG